MEIKKKKNFKENIEVCVRMRPKLIHEKEETINLNLGNNSIEIFTKNNLNKDKEYLFSNIYDENSNNHYIYQNSVKKIISGTFEGINGSIFLYGHTGSGKTYSMIGYDKLNQVKNNRKLVTSKTNFLQSPVMANNTLRNFNLKREKSSSNVKDPGNKPIGILQISVEDIFFKIWEDKENDYEIFASYFEIYNDNIYDLLDSSFYDPNLNLMNKSFKPLKIKENTKTQEFYISGLIKEKMNDYEEFIKIFENGEKNRHFASTTFNHHSSRSHTLFKVYIKKTDKTNNIVTSSIDFIDLAGSEKIKEFGNEKTNEGKYINKSLFFLTQIISIKSSNEKLAHVPYRNSPLTKLLKNSIGGNARTIIMLCVSPVISSLENNIFTLNFGLIAKKIKNEIRVNIDYESSEDEEISNLSKLDGGYEKKLNDLIQQNKKLKKNYELFFDKKLIKEMKDDIDKKTIILENCGLIKSHFFDKKKYKIEDENEVDLELLKNVKKLKNIHNEDFENYTKKIKDLKEELSKQKMISDMILKGKVPSNINLDEINSFEINCWILLENIKINKVKKLILEENPDLKEYLDKNMLLKKVPKIDENNIDFLKDHKLLGIPENLDNGDLLIN